MKMKIKPYITNVETNFVFFTKILKKVDCIGYLRGDFGIRGTEFWTNWFDVCGDLKTDDFKAAFDEDINILRENILANRNSLIKYCNESGRKISEMDEYGARIDSGKYTYMCRLNPARDNYNFYIYCYEKEKLDKHIERVLLDYLSEEPKAEDENTNEIEL